MATTAAPLSFHRHAAASSVMSSSAIAATASLTSGFLIDSHSVLPSRKRRYSDSDDGSDSGSDSDASVIRVAVYDASASSYAAATTRPVVVAAKHRITHFSEAQVEREAAAYLVRVGRRAGRANIFDV